MGMFHINNGVFLFFILLTISSKSISQNIASEILSHSYDRINDRHNIKYKGVYKIKFFDKDDTNIFRSTVFLTRTVDSIFNGKFFFTLNEDSSYKFYDLNRLYFVENRKKNVTVYNPHAGETSIVNGSISSSVILKYFFYPNEIRKFLTPSFSISLCNDTMIENNLCYQISIKSKKVEDDFTDERNLFFVKRDYLPILERRIVTYQGNIQYTELLITEYSFKDISTTQYTLRQVPHNYRKSYNAKQKNEEKAIKKILTCTLSGANFQNDLKRNTVDFEGKVTLIDFWYMSCPPCIKSIPILEKIADKYKNKESEFQVIGVNYYDNKPDRLKKVPIFLRYNPINYPILFVNKDVIDCYGVDTWPTFLVIDKHGKVIYIQRGVSDDLFQSLCDHIDRNF